MSIRTATMTDSYSTTPHTSGFFRKLVLLLLFISANVAVLAYLDVYQTNLDMILMIAFAVTVLGLAIGLGSRIIFYHSSGFVRYSITVLILPPSMLALGFFTAWRIGFGPLDPWLAGKVDWFELVQLAWALLIALFSLRAWWKPAVKADEVEVSESHYSSPPRERVHPRAAGQRFHLHLPESWTPRPIPEVNRVVIPKSIKPARAKRRKGSNRKPEVQFSVYEEHRCPYCLDLVKRNDARGVKECEVCHSLHHADCWNITGMCQVPHLNT
jgi:hypothetical protein